MNSLGKSYNDFQNNFGQNVDLDYKSIIKSLFSVDFKKVANGVELVSNAEGLLSQLDSVKKAAGLWTIDAKECITSLCGNKHTISYILNTEKFGKFGVIAIITISDRKLIDLVNEVYYQF
jgi:hypothetical protein